MSSRLRTSIGLALTAVATLMLELLLIRTFDAILTTNMAYMVITCAMFAFGLSGVYVSLRPLAADADVGRYIFRISLGFALFALLLLPVINWLPFDYDRIGTDPLQQLLYFGALYLALTVPFFLSGLVFTTVFSAYSEEIRSLYFFDLCGAAIGCVLVIPLIPRIGPGGSLFVVASLNVVAAVLFLGRTGVLGKALATTALVLLLVPFARSDGYYDFREHTDKRGVRTARQSGDIEVTRWDPIAKIDVVNMYEEQDSGTRTLIYRHVAYDGGSQSSRLFPFHGDLAALREQLERDLTDVDHHFWDRSVFASHRFRADSGTDALIIGSAGGQETKAALMYNPRSVDAVEMVRTVVDLSTDEYADYIGDVFGDPRVNVVVGEGRTFLRSNDKKYDIIQIFSNHTSSSMAAGSGSTGPVYLQTVEAYVEYFSSLEDDGILHINHHIYPRMIATAAVAWKELGRDDFRRHVLVYERSGRDDLPLVLFKMTPWTRAEVQAMRDFMRAPGSGERFDTFALVEDPIHPHDSFLSGAFYSGELPSAVIENAGFRVAPTTDDRPFFNFLRQRLGETEPAPERFLNASTAGLLNSQLTDARHIPMDVAHFFVTGVASLFFAVVFILVPLFFSSTGRARWPGEFTSLFYFSCLGMGFIVVELTFIQVFMKLIGYPLYTYSAVIFTMLLAAGVGSNTAERWRVEPRNRWWLPFAGTLVFGLLLWAFHPMVFERFLASSMPVRVLVAALLIFPMSFFMGMALPLGILAISDKPKGAVAWAWGMNGLFTTIGGVGAAILSLYLGFRVTLLIAFAVYLLAGLAFWRLKTFSVEPLASDHPRALA